MGTHGETLFDGQACPNGIRSPHLEDDVRFPLEESFRAVAVVAVADAAVAADAVKQSSAGFSGGNLLFLHSPVLRLSSSPRG